MGKWASGRPPGSAERLALISTDTQPAEAQRLRAQVLRDDGHFDDAMAALASLQDARSQRLRGLILAESGQAALAMPLLDGALADGETDVEARLWRARAHTAMEAHTAAVADYSRFFADHPRPSPDHHLEQATALVQAGRPADAQTALDQALLLHGQTPALVLAAVELAVAQGQLDTALAHLDRARLASTFGAPWWLRQGALLEAAGRSDQAAQAYTAGLTNLRSRPARRQNTAALADLATQLASGLARTTSPDSK